MSEQRTPYRIRRAGDGRTLLYACGCKTHDHQPSESEIFFVHPGEGPAVKRRIVRAVNAHDGLLAALRALQHCRAFHDTPRCICSQGAALMAIALAEGS